MTPAEIDEIAEEVASFIGGEFFKPAGLYANDVRAEAIGAVRKWAAWKKKAKA